MSYRRPGARRSIVALFTSIFLLITSALLIYASDDTTTLNLVNPEWVRNLPAISCPGSSNTYCHQSSPVVADITGDGKLEIVVATNNGHVLTFRHDGSLLWQTDVGPLFGMGSGQQQIASSPAVADIDKDGKMEVVVGVGTIYTSVCTKGGVIVLDHNGRVEPGWPFITQDYSIDPSGCPDTVYSTPALGDLDKDGDLEIVFSSFDKSVYALHHNGKLVAGFPPNSNHYARFGWEVLRGRMADTSWSSPALADINGNGYLDIVIGSDEGNFDNTWPSPVGDWSCPYRPPITGGYCGGSLYAFDRSGRQLDGFPRYKHETIQSSPAIMDIDNNGQSEIFFGTGSWYYKTSPDHPTLGFRLFGMDSKGDDLSGWQGGKVVGGFVAASPSIGDITGDGKPNIVAAASDNRLYAWHVDGQPVVGFPMIPRTYRNTVLDGYNVGASFILADYTGDGIMEIFLRHAWEIIIVNGKGQQMTASYLDDSRPVYLTKGTILNNPAVGDLDGDGHLELVVQNSQLTVWDLPTSTRLADWPMFKRDAARSSAQESKVKVVTEEIVLMVEAGQDDIYRQSVYVFGSLGKFDWKVRSNRPDNITFPQTTGVGIGQEVIGADIHVSSGLSIGDHILGNIEVEVSLGDSVEMTDIVPVKVRVVRDLSKSYLPFIH